MINYAQCVMVGSSAHNWTACLTQRACPTWLDSCVGQLNYGPHKQHVQHSWTAVLDSSTVAHTNIMSHKIKHYVPHKQHVPNKHVPQTWTLCPSQWNSLSHTITFPTQSSLSHTNMYPIQSTVCPIKSNSMSPTIKQHVPQNQTCPIRSNTFPLQMCCT